MKLDRNYDDFFNSVGFAIVLCTMIVAVGKSITNYYFFYIITFVVLLILSMAIYNYNIHRYKLKQYKGMIEENFQSAYTKKFIREKLLESTKYVSGSSSNILSSRNSLRKWTLTRNFNTKKGKVYGNVVERQEESNDEADESRKFLIDSSEQLYKDTSKMYIERIETAI